MKLAPLLLVLASACRIAFDPVDSPGAVDQSALANATCEGDVLHIPTARGMFVDTQCAWGCIADGVAHCGELAPIGGAIASDDLGTNADLDDVTFGSSDGVIVDGNGGSITNARGPGRGTIAGISFDKKDGVAIFRAASFDLRSLRIVGDGPIVFIAEGPIVIEHDIIARGCASSPTEPGPGGLAGGTESAPATDPRQGANGGGMYGTGGGGGGNGGNGGNGGSTKGGTSLGDPFALVGGGGGGAGFANGGGGGGAVQFVSATSIEVRQSGSIDAGGCGGSSTESFPYHGGGGGAGGTIILEAPAVSVAGTLAVNGGGGGGSNAPGQIAQLARLAALGGDSGGGNGGFALASNGGASTYTQSGGGGAVGRIVFDTHALDVKYATLSPALYDGTTAVAHTPEVY